MLRTFRQNTKRRLAKAHQCIRNQGKDWLDKLTALMIGPIAQFIFIPFMTTGRGVELIGGWFGSGPDRGIALVFTITGIIGLAMTLLALRSRFYRQLSQRYLAGAADPQLAPQASHAPHLASIEAER